MQKDFVKEYMSSLPEKWDDVKFIDGFPGKFVVLARKNGNNWYIAGINGENTPRNLVLNIPFVNNSTKSIMIKDSENANILVEENVNLSAPLNLTLQPYGGFVIKTLVK